MKTSWIIESEEKNYSNKLIGNNLHAACCNYCQPAIKVFARRTEENA
jgi:hypothetical protein